MAEIKQFLDKVGLETFWSIIKDNFATKSSAVSYDSMSFTKSETAVALSFSNLAAGDKFKQNAIQLPIASNSQAGIITKETYDKIDSMSSDVQNAIKINKFKLNGSEVVPTTADKAIDIKLEYKTNVNAEGDAYIRLTDSNNAAVYSQINVTDFIKTGLLNYAELIVNPSGQTAGTYIHLSFATNNNQSDDVYINVTDLIDYYIGGEGISITAEGVADDGNRNERTISIRAAETEKLGGVKLGYTETGKTYAVKLNASNRAYVEVPWYKVNGDNVNIIASNDDTNKITSLSLSSNVTNSLGLANSALQSVNVLGVSLNGSSNTISVDTAKEKLGLNDAAYKDVISDFSGTPADGVADAGSIKTYVDTEVAKITGTSGYQQAIENAINSLDSSITAANVNSKKTFFTKIDIVDGKLTNNFVSSIVTLNDIDGFSVLSTTDIESICTFE